MEGVSPSRSNEQQPLKRHSNPSACNRSMPTSTSTSHNAKTPDLDNHQQWLKHTVGIGVLLCTVVVWVLSSELIQFIYADDDTSFQRPFFVTFFDTSMFSVYLLGFVVCPSWTDGRLHRKVLAIALSLMRSMHLQPPHWLQVSGSEPPCDTPRISVVSAAYSAEMSLRSEPTFADVEHDSLPGTHRLIGIVVLGGCGAG
jgi:hypothetical protein